MRLQITFLLLLPLFAAGQSFVDSITGEVNFRQVTPVKFDQEQLKTKVEKWVAVEFDNNDELIKLSDRENIIIKGSFTRPISSGKYNLSQMYKLTIDIAFKDERMKVEMYDVLLNSESICPGLELPFIYKTVTLELLKKETLEYSEAYAKCGIPYNPKRLRKIIDKMGQKEVNESQSLYDQHLANIQRGQQVIYDSLIAFLDQEAEKDDW